MVYDAVHMVSFMMRVMRVKLPHDVVHDVVHGEVHGEVHGGHGLKKKDFVRFHNQV